MSYKLGKRSLEKLTGVDERMVAVVKYAINVTKQDFSVICGLRTIEEQKVLVAKGASQKMKSKHIDGLAVDLMAYVDGGRWELNLYDEIADAMAEGARAVDVPIIWGAAWSVPNIAQYGEGNMEDAMNSYIDLRRSQGRRPFIDGPHFELVV
jgi:peptidoglycan L-alanyl-D-glutamate endopeptidase CwlK